MTDWVGSIIMVTFLSGSGAMLFSAGLTAVLQTWKSLFQRRRILIRTGIGLGMILGLVNFYATNLIIPWASIWRVFRHPEAFWILLAAALLGGAGLGLGSSLAVPFKRASPKTI